MIPLLDGEFAIGQIIGQVGQVLGRIVCAYFDIKAISEECASKMINNISDKDVVAVLFTISEALDWIDSDMWKVFYNGKPLPLGKYFNEKQLKDAPVGISIKDAGIAYDLMKLFMV